MSLALYLGWTTLWTTFSWLLYQITLFLLESFGWCASLNVLFFTHLWTSQIFSPGSSLSPSSGLQMLASSHANPQHSLHFLAAFYLLHIIALLRCELLPSLLVLRHCDLMGFMGNHNHLRMRLSVFFLPPRCQTATPPPTSCPVVF